MMKPPKEGLHFSAFHVILLPHNVHHTSLPCMPSTVPRQLDLGLLLALSLELWLELSLEVRMELLELRMALLLDQVISA